MNILLISALLTGHACQNYYHFIATQSTLYSPPPYIYVTTADTDIRTAPLWRITDDEAHYIIDTNGLALFQPSGVFAYFDPFWSGNFYQAACLETLATPIYLPAIRK